MRRRRAFFLLLLTGIVLALCHAIRGADTQPTSPGQPASGPGGADYAYAAVTTQSFGAGDTQYWIFTPAQPVPTAPLPVIIFTHGWGAMGPAPYMAWLQHLARKGNIVIYPRYQASLKTPSHQLSANALAAVRDALTALQNPDQPVKPNLAMCATVGHSAGGNIAANLAVDMPAAGLPTPKAVMCVQPGKSWGPERIQIPLSNDLAKVAASTLLLTVVGDVDHLAKDVDAKKIFSQTTAIPVTNKNYITLVSDDHGSPSLVANHFAPCAPLPGATSDINALIAAALDSSSDSTTGNAEDNELREKIREKIAERMAEKQNGSDSDKAAKFKAQFTTNTLDYYGTWKLFDALTDAAFYNKNRDVALGGGSAQTFMGIWSDGVPVKPLRVTTTP